MHLKERLDAEVLKHKNSDAVDENNNTLVNRDLSVIKDCYTFEMFYINTPPNMSGIPDVYMFEQLEPPERIIDFTDYTIDNSWCPCIESAGLDCYQTSRSGHPGRPAKMESGWQ